MSLEKCPVCDEYIWEWSAHKCKPAYYVFRDEEELYDALNQQWNLKTFFATDSEQAAIKYCESDYENPSDLDVLVVDKKIFNEALDMLTEDNTDIIVEKLLPHCTKYNMESELVRNFWATRIP